MKRYFAIKELWDEDFKTKPIEDKPNIPEGTEIEYFGEVTNYYGRYAKVNYKDRFYYVKPCDLRCEGD